MCHRVRVALQAFAVAVCLATGANAQADEAEAKPAAKRKEHNQQTFDANGRLIEETRESDTNNDGVNDRKDTSTFTYDEKGRLTKKVKWSRGAKKRCETNTLTYEGDSRQLVGEFKEVDANGDGKVDSTSQASFKYAKGKLVEKNTVFFPVADGPPKRRETVKSEYGDKEKELLRETLVKIALPSNKLLASWTSEFTYANKKMATKTTIYDLNGDGQIDQRNRVEFTYNANGSLASTTSEIDHLKEGETPIRRTATYSADRDFKAPPSNRAWVIAVNTLVLIVLGGFVFRKRWALSRAQAASAGG